MIARMLVAAFALMSAVGLAQADDWAGFYNGIDEYDGSLDRQSIVPNGDGTYRITIKSDAFSVCDATDPGAFMEGTGRVVDGTMVRQDTVIHCSGGVDVPVGDRSYALDQATGTLTYDSPEANRILAYHRMSSGPGDQWPGLYCGIDPGDGSFDRMSIVTDSDGTYRIRVKSTSFGSCDTTEPHAVMIGTGRMVDGQLVRQKTKLVCADGEEKALDDRTLTLDPETGIISLSANQTDRTLYYHRMSQ